MYLSGVFGQEAAQKCNLMRAAHELAPVLQVCGFFSVVCGRDIAQFGELEGSAAF